ncbi:MAG TPA: PH domain-containing protein [Longimicrobiales bacterium]|nr:PH domain-containing protein [Longimicrobiales bacterium]
MPIDRGVIDQQLLALRESSQWWDQREFRDLPAVLHADEQIIALARGKVARLRWLRRKWLIVVTDRRILCLRSAGRTGWRQIEVAAEQIERVALRVGLFRGRVLVIAGGQTFRLLVPRLDAYRLMTALSSLGTHAKDTFTGFGPTRIVRRVMDHVLALPAAALDPTVPRVKVAPVDTSIAERRVQTLEEEVQELRQQVDFLEQLLRERHPALNADQKASG